MIGGRILWTCVLLSGVVGGSPVVAEDFAASRVGRISAADGSVAVRRAGGEWTDSGVNEPVAAGTSVRTGAAGRATLGIGDERIALAADSEIDLPLLDRGSTQIVLRRGRIGVRLAAGDTPRNVEIDIQRGGIWLLTPGEYAVAAGDAKAATRLDVFDGHARFVGKGAETTLATASAVVIGG